MELRHLRYFQAVAETLSFSRAAERMKVAQPPLSRQIRDLENELGVKLFTRSGGRVQLTEAGSHFHKELDRLLTQLAIILTETQQIGKGCHGNLKLGTDWRIPVARLANAAADFRRQHSDAQVDFVEIPIHEQLEALRERRIDMAFMPMVSIGSSQAGLELMCISSPEVMAALPVRHPAAKKKKIRLIDLKDETWITLDRKQAPGFRSLTMQICREAGFTQKIGRSAQTVDGMLALVAAGEGVCLTLVEAGSVSSANLDTIRLIPTDCAPFKLFAVWLKDSGSALVEQYASILRSHVA